jgi:hypothetical protein
MFCQSLQNESHRQRIIGLRRSSFRNRGCRLLGHLVDPAIAERVKAELSKRISWKPATPIMLFKSITVCLLTGGGTGPSEIAPTGHPVVRPSIVSRIAGGIGRKNCWGKSGA